MLRILGDVAMSRRNASNGIAISCARRCGKDDRGFRGPLSRFTDAKLTRWAYPCGVALLAWRLLSATTEALWRNGNLRHRLLKC